MRGWQRGIIQGGFARGVIAELASSKPRNTVAEAGVTCMSLIFNGSTMGV
jgi:hypothetical protein